MKTDPGPGYSYSQVLKIRGRAYPRDNRGQVIVQKWPRKRPGPKSEVAQAWQNYFSCLASIMKQPDGRSVDFANKFRDGARWFVRDVLYAAAHGDMFHIEGETTITTPTACVKRAANIAAANGTDTVVEPTSQDWDNNQFWDPVTNPKRLTIKSPGLYLIGAELEFTAVAGGSRRCWIRLNGTSFISRQSVPGTSAGAQQVCTSRPYYFHQNDYIECGYFQNSAGVNVKMNEFWVIAISPETLIDT